MLVFTSEITNGVDVFKLRVAGPEIVQPAVHYCEIEGKQLAYAPIVVTRSGEYKVEVLHLYSGFSFSSPPPANEVLQVALLPITFLPEEAAQAYEGITGCSQEKQSEGKCDAHEACRAGPTAGRWVLANGVTPELLGIEETCAFYWNPRLSPGGEWCPATYDTSVGVNTDKLRWEPYTCDVVPDWKNVEDAPCGVQRMQQDWRVCFAGDSHSRFAHNLFAAALNGSKADDFDAHHHSTKDVAYSPYTNFTWSPWLKLKEPGVPVEEGQWTFVDPPAISSDNFEGCTDVVVGHGQWDLSWPYMNKYKRPATLEEYAAKLHEVAGFLLNLRASFNTRVYFYLMPSYPLSRKTHRDPVTAPETATLGMDYRSDPYLVTFNRMAQHVMSHAGIPTIDAYSASSALNELSFDKMHYVGSVGHALVKSAVSVLCPAEDVDYGSLMQHPRRHLRGTSTARLPSRAAM